MKAHLLKHMLNKSLSGKIHHTRQNSNSNYNSRPIDKYLVNTVDTTHYTQHSGPESQREMPDVLPPVPDTDDDVIHRLR